MNKDAQKRTRMKHKNEHECRGTHKNASAALFFLTPPSPLNVNGPISYFNTLRRVNAQTSFPRITARLSP